MVEVVARRRNDDAKDQITIAARQILHFRQQHPREHTRGSHHTTHDDDPRQQSDLEGAVDPDQQRDYPFGDPICHAQDHANRQHQQVDDSCHAGSTLSVWVRLGQNDIPIAVALMFLQDPHRCRRHHSHGDEH